MLLCSSGLIESFQETEEIRKDAAGEKKGQCTDTIEKPRIKNLQQNPIKWQLQPKKLSKLKQNKRRLIMF